uniref:PDZ binding kinase n=1 Tax=Falco tinnunculus TaxID=100819 RepID=A0A8C4XTD6_FALTI
MGLGFSLDAGPVSVTIPASPFMQKLGYGTGVNVYLMKRYVPKHSGAIRPASTWKQLVPASALTNQSLLEGYRAFTEANDGSMCLAMEYGGEKSLNDLIEERSAKRLGPFPAAMIFKVALSMARGLKYLHNDKKLLHGDIKSSNVVVKGDFEAIKICDVGVSLPLDENMTVSNPEMCYIGTEPWKPKEALQDDGVITDKADIFPFGLTLWEMMTLSVPHISLSGDTDDEGESFDEDSFDEEAYYAALGTRPALNMDELDPSYQHMIDLFSVCTSEDPKKRPSAACIVEVLEASLPQE